MLKNILLVTLTVFATFSQSGAGTSDLYSVLGLERGSLERDIKKAYRSLSLLYHPDKQRSADEAGKQKANSRFVEIQKAYSTLSDPEKKRVYDLQLQLEESGAETKDGRQISRGRGTWDSGSNTYAAGQRGGFQQAELITSETVVLNDKNFERFVFKSSKTWVIQIYDDTSDSCQRAAPAWEQVAHSLDGIAKFGRINAFENPHLVRKLGSSALFSKAIRHFELPVIFGFRSGCRHFSCAKRYRGTVKENSLTSFVSQSMLRLPKLVTVDTHHINTVFDADDEKVRFYYISKSDQSLMIRHLTQQYKADIDVRQVRYKVGHGEFWNSTYGVNTIPSVLILKENVEPIVEPVKSRDQLRAVFVKHRFQPIPKLTSSNSRAAGCQPGGLTRACVILIQRANSKTVKDMKRILDSIKRDIASAIGFAGDELTFGWTSDSILDGSKLENASRKAKIVVFLFTDNSEEFVYFDIYQGDDEPHDVLSWMTNTLAKKHSDMRGLSRVSFEAVTFPEVYSPVWKPLISALLIDTFDFLDALWVFSLENGIIPLAGTICAVIIGNSLRKMINVNTLLRSTLHKMPAVAQPSSKALLVDVHGIPLQRRSVYIVMAFTTEAHASFRKLAKHFITEKLLCFVEVDPSTEPQFYDTLDDKSSVVVWHPSKDKYQIVGDLNDDDIRIIERLDSILNGLGEWTRVGMPFHTQNRISVDDSNLQVLRRLATL